MPTDIQARLAALPELVFKTLTEKIYAHFPRASAIDRQHVKILFVMGLIEKAELGMAPGKEFGAYKILVPTLECQNALIAMGAIQPGMKQNV